MSNLLHSRLTPYDDDYGTSARAVASLHIYSGSIEPNAVSTLLGLSPTKILIRGRVTETKHGQKVDPQNAWFLSSEGSVVSRDLRRHLDWLLTPLYIRRTELQQLQEMTDVKMRINCVWWSACGHGGPALWPEQMKLMAELNLECDFDIYFFPDED